MATHNQHELYREAERRQSQKQPVVKHSADGALLLTAPNNIIFELFHTVVEEIPTHKLMDYVTRNLSNYLQSNWHNKTTKRAIERLSREQAFDVKAGLVDLPIIRRFPAAIKSAREVQKPAGSKFEGAGKQQQEQSQKSPPLNYKPSGGISEAVKQVYEHIMWRINTKNVTQITSLIVKLALDAGYKEGKLKAQLYDEVATCFEDWRSNKLIKLYAFGNAPPNDQILLLSSTNKGDLTKWIANYIDGTEKREKPDLIRKLAGALRDKTKNCIFITNDLSDAVRSYQTDSLRCAFVVDRENRYETLRLSGVPDFAQTIEPLIESGKLYIISSLNCVQFAPDPSSSECC